MRRRSGVTERNDCDQQLAADQTRVVHVRDALPDAVYIGREFVRYDQHGRCIEYLGGSIWGNPYRIGVDGDRATVIAKYEELLLHGVRRKMLRCLPRIRGKPLACWCRHDGEPRTPDNACHGDVLVALLARYTDDELREMGGGDAR